MTPNTSLNPLLAWLLAFAIAVGPAIGLAWWLFDMFGRLEDPAGDWPYPVLTGLLFATLLIRPLENLIRKHGYGLPSVEEAQGRTGGRDRVSDAAETALSDRLKRERQKRK
ncbi:hypothetical protein [Maricaulis sp. CAU 1757]